MSTKNNPGNYDCYANAEPDEEMFVLLARDAFAPALVRAWAINRKLQIDRGTKPQEDMQQVTEAHECAEKMEKWFQAKVEALRGPPDAEQSS